MTVHFLLILNLKLQLLQKFEANENSQRFPGFRFLTLGKIKNSEIFDIGQKKKQNSEIFLFSNCYLLVLNSVIFLVAKS